MATERDRLAAEIDGVIRGEIDADGAAVVAAVATWDLAGIFRRLGVTRIRGRRDLARALNAVDAALIEWAAERAER